MEDNKIEVALEFLQSRKDLFKEHHYPYSYNIEDNKVTDENYVGRHIFATDNYHVFSTLDHPESHGFIVTTNYNGIAIGLHHHVKHPCGYIFAVIKNKLCNDNKYGKLVSVHKIYDNLRAEISIEQFLVEINKDSDLAKYILFNMDIDFYVPRLTSAIC
jgi:hypothetical protein